MRLLVLAVFLVLCVESAAAPKRKVIIDQDAFGPGGPNLQPILMVLQAPDVEKTSTGYLARTPFIYTETRGDESQRYAATAWHNLAVVDGALHIRLKRVDILNADSALPSIQLFL